MEEYRSTFQALEDNFRKFENFQDVTPENIEKALKQADLLKRMIAQEGLLSSNEILEDLPTEHIPLLFTSYYQACILLRNNDQETRENSLNFAQASLDEFLMHLDNYRIVGEDFIERWKHLAEPNRDQKIAEFRYKKELENKVKAFEERNDPDELRDLYEEKLRMYAQESLGHLRFIKLELQMIQMKNDRVELPQNPHTGKPQVIKIDQSNIGLMPSIIAGTQGIEEARQKIRNQVFQPGHNLPTMTVEEYGEWQLKQIQEQERKMAQMPQPEEKDSSDEEEQEAKRKKDADWDDWKDAHEKGAGNKMR